MARPYIFDEFFASGQDETISPFLTPSSRKWGKNVPLKGAITSTFLLLFAFILSFSHPNASHLCLASVYFLVGTPALLNTFKDLQNLDINIDVLMTLAAFLSIGIGSGLEGALLLVLFELSGSMESAVTKKTKSALLSLRKISPSMAVVIKEDGRQVYCPISEVTIGSHILIKAGETVPLDGKVIAGHSFVNLIHLTGESLPLSKKVGDQVPAGAHNLDGSLTLAVNRTSHDSTLSHIIKLITEAEKAKPKLERLFDRFSKSYSITIILLSLLFALSLPPVFGISFLGAEGSIYRALTFLIAASPCALIIATPTAYLSSLSSCAKKGILLKGGTILDALATCSIIAFDKTGTLTSGKLTCSKIEPLNASSIDTNQALGIAAGIERHAVHPIAEAIEKMAKNQGTSLYRIDHFQSLPGLGLKGEVTIEGETLPVYIGHPDLIAAHTQERLQTQQWEVQNTFLLIGEALFIFHFIDEIRPESHEALSTLSKKNIKTLLLTGDHTKNAHIIGESLGIQEVYSNLRSKDKLEKVAQISQKKGLIMVGDGINDAPALSRATVGISMGKIGSATAVDASDIVFLQDDLSLLSWLIDKATKTVQIVRQNLILALGVIILATTPALLGYIPLWLAVVLHEGGTVLVGLNSLRLLRK